MTTVLEQWEMCCPECKSDESLDISAILCVRLTPDGTDADASRIGDQEWRDDSPITCGCGWSGKVADARVDMEAHRQRAARIQLACRYLNDDREHHMRAHGKWHLDAGTLEAALEEAALGLSCSFVTV